MKSCGYGEHIVRLYTEASSRVYINGWQSRAFSIQCSVRQGCPLSMVLFTLALNRLLVLLDSMLEGLKIGKRTVKYTSLAYADDVTVLLTSRADVVQLREAIRVYERATGARLNPVKTKVIPIGAWDTTEPICNLPYTNDATVFGLRFTGTLERSMQLNWTTITTSVKLRAQEMYMQDLCLKQRIKVVHKYLLSKLRYAAQVFPLPTSHARQLTTAIIWFIWHLEIFRLPTSTLYRKAADGGLELIDHHAKCATLYLLRLQQQQESSGIFTAVWLDRWRRFQQTANPPVLHHMPLALFYLRPFFLEWVYTGKRLEDNTPRALKRRVYGVLREYNRKSTTLIPIWIHKRHPHKNWRAI